MATQTSAERVLWGVPRWRGRLPGRSSPLQKASKAAQAPYVLPPALLGTLRAPDRPKQFAKSVYLQLAPNNAI